MNRIFFIIGFLSSVMWSHGQTIDYTISFDNIIHHELRVKIDFAGIESEVLEIRMPNSSPGRYAEHNFIKNVYEEKALDKAGNEVALRRISPFAWEVGVRDGTVKFEYTLYGDHADGTYVGIDAKKIHLNMPAAFAYGLGLEKRKISLTVPAKRPGNWKVASQLVQENDTTFSAPDYAYFYDSPVLIGDLDWREWTLDGQTIEVAMMHNGSDGALDTYVKWIQDIVQTQKQIFGELPKFDFDRYTFLISYNPWVVGDAMEHRNSTMITSTGSLEDNASKLIGTVAHEFFHGWNIERIRPKSLEPFDFDRANLSEALWFGEGFTNYFEELSLCRSGIATPDQYVQRLSRGLNYVLFSPGREIRGPMEMSYQAVFTDAGTSNDPTNYLNTFISYYSYGEVIALGLDLTLRTEFDKTLDEYMRKVWQLYGKPEKPYTMADLQSVLASLTNPDFASTFFKEQIEGSALPNFEPLFENFGIKVSLRNPNSAYFNNPRLSREGVVESHVLRGTALYEAGIEKGDRIISINDQEIEFTSDLNRAINQLEIGKSYGIQFEQMGEIKTATFLARQDPRITLSYLPDSKLKKKVIKRRNAWLKIND